jgi:hypothetical protein
MDSTLKRWVKGDKQQLFFRAAVAAVLLYFNVRGFIYIFTTPVKVEFLVAGFLWFVIFCQVWLMFDNAKKALRLWWKIKKE